MIGTVRKRGLIPARSTRLAWFLNGPGRRMLLTGCKKPGVCKPSPGGEPGHSACRLRDKPRRRRKFGPGTVPLGASNQSRGGN